VEDWVGVTPPRSFSRLRVSALRAAVPR
jgi:hypothetical protein